MAPAGAPGVRAAARGVLAGLCRVAAVAHTCAVCYGARRREALTTPARRNVAPARPRALWPWRVGSSFCSCSPGFWGGVGGVGFSRFLAALLGIPVQRRPTRSPFHGVSAPFPQELWRPSSLEAVSPAVTFAFFFCCRRQAGKESGSYAAFTVGCVIGTRLARHFPR